MTDNTLNRAIASFVAIFASMTVFMAFVAFSYLLAEGTRHAKPIMLAGTLIAIGASTVVRYALRSWLLSRLHRDPHEDPIPNARVVERD